LTTDAAAQQEFKSSGGLCPSHTWQLERLSSPRGLCTSYPALVEGLSQRVGALAGLPGAVVSERLAALLSQTATCAACLVRERSEQEGAARVVEGWVTRPRGTGADETPRLCLPHLRLLVAALDEQGAATLIRRQAQRLVEVSEAMQGYRLKFDALRRDLLTLEERTAHRDALVLLVGERNLSVVPTEEI
jgi:hypothetical protein